MVLTLRPDLDPEDPDLDLEDAEPEPETRTLRAGGTTRSSFLDVRTGLPIGTGLGLPDGLPIGRGRSADRTGCPYVRLAPPEVSLALPRFSDPARGDPSLARFPVAMALTCTWKFEK